MITCPVSKSGQCLKSVSADISDHPACIDRCDRVAELIRDLGFADLQKRAVSWHTKRFPDAIPFYVALKAIAELGEMADAIITRIGANGATGNPGDGITGEAADVVITLLVLTGRWCKEDLLSAVDRKLKVLETPEAHRASIRSVTS